MFLDFSKNFQSMFAGYTVDRFVSLSELHFFLLDIESRHHNICITISTSLHLFLSSPKVYSRTCIELNLSVGKMFNLVIISSRSLVKTNYPELINYSLWLIKWCIL